MYRSLLLMILASCGAIVGYTCWTGSSPITLAIPFTERNLADAATSVSESEANATEAARFRFQQNGFGNPSASLVWHEPDIGDEFGGGGTASDPTVPTDQFLGQLPGKAHDVIYLLYWLHRTSVRAFEAAPRFGSERMTTFSLFDDPSPPKHRPGLSTDRGFYNDRAFPYGINDRHLIKGLPVPSEAWMWLHLMHGITARGFVYGASDLRPDLVEQSKGWGGGFGGPDERDWRIRADKKLTAEERDAGSGFLVGIPRPNGSIEFHRYSLLLDPSAPLDEKDRLWKVVAVQLVSLLKHDPPVVYENRELTMAASAGRNRGKTRPLDDIEIESLEKLREGTQRVVGWNEQHNRLQMLGAIRAKDRCLECHKVERGDLLGAFTFWIEEERNTSPETDPPE